MYEWNRTKRGSRRKRTVCTDRVLIRQAESVAFTNTDLQFRSNRSSESFATAFFSLPQPAHFRIKHRRSFCLTAVIWLLTGRFRLLSSLAVRAEAAEEMCPANPWGI